MIEVYWHFLGDHYRLAWLVYHWLDDDLIIDWVYALLFTTAGAATTKNESDIISVFIFDYISERRQNVLKKEKKGEQTKNL